MSRLIRACVVFWLGCSSPNAPLFAASPQWDAAVTLDAIVPGPDSTVGDANFSGRDALVASDAALEVDASADAGGAGGSGTAGAGMAGAGGTGGMSSSGAGGNGGTGGTQLCVMHTYYRDADNDHYGNDGDAVLACSKPDGYYTRGGDCYDGNANAKPGQDEPDDWFDEHRGDGSFDYNCDGEETPKWTLLAACPVIQDGGPTIPGSEGWRRTCTGDVCDDMPPCGATWSWKNSAASCPGSSAPLTQECR